MRPGHIRVFDGLRITTEHMNHLQGSLHSAVQDIREILGLGKVYYGFEVVAEGDQAITVQPGLAFDFQKNRIVCDEPKTLEVAFEPEADTLYVCIKSEQVEDGQVEGQFTLIWDSCSVVLRATMPEPKENLIPIAKLIKANGAFEIISLIQGQGEEPERVASEEEESQEEGIETSADGEPSEEPATLLKSEGAGETLTEREVSGKTGKASSTEEESDVKVLPDSEISTLQPKPWRLRVQQGVVRLATDPGSENYLSTVVVEALTQKLISESRSHGEELLFTLAEREVVLDFPVSSLTCHTMISSTFTLTTAEAPGTGTEEVGENPLSHNLEFRSTAQGEATFTDDAVSQVGLSTIQAYPISGPGGMPWWTSELTELGIAHLPFSALLKFAENENPGNTWDILQHLQLLIRVDKTEGKGFKIICNLLWKGGISEEVILKIQTQRFPLTWEAVLAWKVLGELQD